MNSDFEVVQIVDGQNHECGQCTRQEMRARKIIHRATYILVFNSYNDLYVQKRTLSKDIYPGYYDVAAGGVVLAGESYELSAKRELSEELGVVAELVFLFDHYFADIDNKVWGRVFSCRHEGPFILQKEEVESGSFKSIDAVVKEMAIERYTPDGIEIINKILTDGLIDSF
nr:NUDIX domain-containing protein [Desulfobulbaceae bacterium]